MRWGRRLFAWPSWRRLALPVAAVAVLLMPSAAAGHPLGNFSVNHQTRVQISRDRVDLLYILDQAEIPTFQERGLSNAQIVKPKLREIRSDLWLIVNGDRRVLRLRSKPRLTFPPGQGGLKLTRLEVPFRIPVRNPRFVEVQDRTFGERVGWVDIVSLPGKGTRVATAVSPKDPTNALRDYRGISLKGVPDQVIGKFWVGPGKGSLLHLGSGVVYGHGEGPALSPPPASPVEDRSRSSAGSSGDGFAGVFEKAAQGEGIFLLMLLAAFAWGGFHALSPGHGKAMVAAYLVGTRGTPKHAVALGGVVTITHTIGVFALGLVTLALSQYIVPEDLYPWLNLVAGLLIVGVGIAVLRSRIRWGRERRAAALAGPDAHIGHSHGEHHHDHHHHHHHVPEVSWKGLTGMGISAGLIPCPSALVVLLAAITQHQIGLGLVLIVAFSLGLALTLTTLGLVVVYAKRLTSQLTGRLSFSGRVVSMLPAISTLVILGLGVVLTAKAIPDVV